MRESVALLALMLTVVAVTACEALDAPGIDFSVDGPSEFTLPQEQQPMPFTAEGWHVSREDLCGSGTVTIDHLESEDGATITSEEWVNTLNTARKNEGVAAAYLFQVFECEDGSGSFSMQVHAQYDFATFEYGEGELDDFATWQIEEGDGTGSYTDLSGRGDIEIHWDTDEVRYGGEIFP